MVLEDSSSEKHCSLKMLYGREPSFPFFKEFSLQSNKMPKQVKPIFNDVSRQCESQHRASAILLTLELVQDFLKLKITTKLKFKYDKYGNLPSFMDFFPSVITSAPLHAAHSHVS